MSAATYGLHSGSNLYASGLTSTKVATTLSLNLWSRPTNSDRFILVEVLVVKEGSSDAVDTRPSVTGVKWVVAGSSDQDFTLLHSYSWAGGICRSDIYYLNNPTVGVGANILGAATVTISAATNFFAIFGSTWFNVKNVAMSNYANNNRLNVEDTVYSVGLTQTTRRGMSANSIVPMTICSLTARGGAGSAALGVVTNDATTEVAWNGSLTETTASYWVEMGGWINSGFTNNAMNVTLSNTREDGYCYTTLVEIFGTSWFANALFDVYPECGQIGQISSAYDAGSDIIDPPVTESNVSVDCGQVGQVLSAYDAGSEILTPPA